MAKILTDTNEEKLTSELYGASSLTEAHQILRPTKTRLNAKAKRAMKRIKNISSELEGDFGDLQYIAEGCESGYDLVGGHDGKPAFSKFWEKTDDEKLLRAIHVLIRDYETKGIPTELR